MAADIIKVALSDIFHINVESDGSPNQQWSFCHFFVLLHRTKTVAVNAKSRTDALFTQDVCTADRH